MTLSPAPARAAPPLVYAIGLALLLCYGAAAISDTVTNAVDHFQLSGLPGPSIVAGVPFTFSITAKDGSGDTVVDAQVDMELSQNPFTIAGGPGTSPGGYVPALANGGVFSFTNGSSTFRATLYKAETIPTNEFVISFPSADKASEGSTQLIVEPVSDIDYYTLELSTTTPTAGTAFTTTVSAKDFAGNTITALDPMLNTLSFALEGPNAIVSNNGVTYDPWFVGVGAFVAGQADFQTTLYRAESLPTGAFIVSDSQVPPATSTTAPAMTVSPAPLAEYQTLLIGAGPHYADGSVDPGYGTPTPVNVSILALDEYGNASPGDPSVDVAAYTTPLLLGAGRLTGTVTAIDLTTGATTITVYYDALETITLRVVGGASVPTDYDACDVVVFQANAGTIDHFTITGLPPTVTAGTEFSFTMTPRDFGGNIVSDGDVNALLSTMTFEIAGGPSPIGGHVPELANGGTFSFTNGTATFRSTLYRKESIPGDSFLVRQAELNRETDGSMQIDVAASPYIDHYMTEVGPGGPVPADRTTVVYVTVKPIDPFGNITNGENGANLIPVDASATGKTVGYFDGSWQNIDLSSAAITEGAVLDIMYGVGLTVRIEVDSPTALATAPAATVDFVNVLATVASYDPQYTGPVTAGQPFPIKVTARDVFANTVDGIDPILNSAVFDFDRENHGDTDNLPGNAPDGQVPILANDMSFISGTGTLTATFFRKETIPVGGWFFEETTTEVENLTSPALMVQSASLGQYATERIGDPLAVPADGVSTISLRVTPLDAYGNNTTGSQDVALHVSHVSGPTNTSALGGTTTAIDTSTGEVTLYDITYAVAQEIRIHADDGVNGTATGRAAVIQYAAVPRTVVHYTLDLSTAHPTAGTPFVTTITARDEVNNRVTGVDAQLTALAFTLEGPNSITDNNGTPYAPFFTRVTGFTSGRAEYGATLYRAESLLADSFLVSDSQVPPATSAGTPALTVSPAHLVEYQTLVTGAGPHYADGSVDPGYGTPTPVSVSILALDRYGNATPGDPAVDVAAYTAPGVPGSGRLTGAVAAIDMTPGSAAITVYYDVLETVTLGVAGGASVSTDYGASDTIAFQANAGTIDHFALALLPLTVRSGVPFGFFVRARDYAGNLVADAGVNTVLSALPFEIASGPGPDGVFVPSLHSGGVFTFSSGQATFIATFYRPETIPVGDFQLRQPNLNRLATGAPEIEVVGGDSDGDRMPDTWETYHFGGPLAANSRTDADLDGVLDWCEYVAGTDPTNSSSAFAVLIERAPGSTSIVHMPTLEATGTGYTGKTRYYALQQSTDLRTGIWQPVPGLTNLPATGSTVIYTNSAPSPVLNFRAQTWLTP